MFTNYLFLCFCNMNGDVFSHWRTNTQNIKVFVYFNVPQGQLVLRHGGSTGATAVVRRLQFVWISHRHLDHHFGLLRLLEQRRSADGPLLVIG